MPLTEYESLDEPLKRGKSGRTIMAFPRVGRSEIIEWSQGDQLSGVQRKNDISGNNGLWFGPRLGRLQKRHYKDLPSSAYMYYSDYTPRLGRESEEVIHTVEGTSDDEDVDSNKSS